MGNVELLDSFSKLQMLVITANVILFYHQEITRMLGLLGA